jgi:putative phosphotransacetylase
VVGLPKKLIPVGVSGRHIHLSATDLKKLFGADAELSVYKDLSQTGQFAAKETVLLSGPKGAIPNVRILGPVRGATQVELSQTDCFHLGIPVARRNSGDISNTPGLVVVGPKGALLLEQGAMVAMRHIHMSPDDAKDFGVADGDVVRVGVTGERAVIFENVVVRVHPTFVLELHIDTDEANGAGVRNGDRVQLIPAGVAAADVLDQLQQRAPDAHSEDVH